MDDDNDDELTPFSLVKAALLVLDYQFRLKPETKKG
jgi:hypothetical protein